MWEIEQTKRNDSLETIKFHSTFISIDKIISYKLYPKDKSIEGVEINFVTTRDKEKKQFFIELGDLNNGQLTITYYNPGIGQSGLREPMTILENDLYFFKIMFNTNFLNNSDTYQLSIEFFIENK